MNTLELYWLRHATSEDKTLGQSDAERHLTPEGFEELRCVGKSLEKLDLDLDYIFCSPLVRAMETAQTVAKILHCEYKVKVCDGLLPENDWEILRRSLKNHLPWRKAMLVGHQPSFGHMIGHLLGPRLGLEIPVKKAGVCRVDIEDLNQNPVGALVWLLTPKLLKKLTKT